MGMDNAFTVGAGSSPMVEKLRFRWQKGWLTRDQLARYVELGVIGNEEMEEISQNA